MRKRKYFWLNNDFKFTPFSIGKNYCFIWDFKTEMFYDECECGNENEIDKDFHVTFLGYSYLKKDIPEKKYLAYVEPAKTERSLYIWFLGHEFNWRW